MLSNLLKLLPANVAREVAVVLATAAAALAAVNELALPLSPGAHRAIDLALALLAALGIRSQVTPLADPKLPRAKPKAR